MAETAVRSRPVPPILPPAKAATFTPAKGATFSVTTVNVPFQGARSALGLAIFQVTREIGVVGGLVAGGFFVSVPHVRNALPGAPVMSERG